MGIPSTVQSWRPQICKGYQILKPKQMQVGLIYVFDAAGKSTPSFEMPDDNPDFIPAGLTDFSHVVPGSDVQPEKGGLDTYSHIPFRWPSDCPWLSRSCTIFVHIMCRYRWWPNIGVGSAANLP